MTDLNTLIQETVRKGLMSGGQYGRIVEILQEKCPCKLLVFGLGNDSYLWNRINEKGKSYFIEDNEDWIKKFNGLNIVHYDYKTEIKDWKELMQKEEELMMKELPNNILSEEWDVIIVDGPVGHPHPCIRKQRKGCNLCPCPGRMQSIYTASKLCKKGTIIVDDYGRDVEREYSNEFICANAQIVENKLAVFNIN